MLLIYFPPIFKNLSFSVISGSTCVNVEQVGIFLLLYILISEHSGKKTWSAEVEGRSRSFKVNTAISDSRHLSKNYSMYRSA